MAVTDLVYTPVGQPITFNVRTNDIGNLMVKGWSVPANLPGTISGTSSTGTVTFTPKPNFSGVATFYYKIGNMNVPDLEIAPVHVVVGNQAPRYPAYHFTAPIGKGIPFSLNLLTPNPGKGDLVRVAVSIGNPNIPVVDLYGFTFDIQLASNIVDSALNLHDKAKNPHFHRQQGFFIIMRCVHPLECLHENLLFPYLCSRLFCLFFHPAWPGINNFRHT